MTVEREEIVDFLLDEEEHENMGLCLNCGNEQHYVEPDAENYTCDVCGENSVQGTLELLLRL